MMNPVLFDEPSIRTSLLPFTFTRPVAKIRVGILSIAEKWEKRLDSKASYQTEKYLSEKFPLTTTGDNLFINGALCPSDSLVDKVLGLKKNEALVQRNELLAVRTSSSHIPNLSSLTVKNLDDEVRIIRNSWQIFTDNATEIRADFDLIIKGRKSQEIPDPHTIIYGKENLFVEKGAKIRAAIINAERGPVYIGRNAEVHEGAIIKGAFALCEESNVNIGAKIRGDTTIGPYCKVGGEVSNSVIFGNSNKGHEGFVGNSVIGEWCNLGADTNTSNLKNNYTDVKIWNYEIENFNSTHQMFCGLMMADHAKCGINTMFNTGTVVGVGANIFGAGFPRNFIPSFAWGGAAGFTSFQLQKAYEVADKVMQRRGKSLDDMEKNIMKHIFDLTAKYRFWETKMSY